MCTNLRIGARPVNLLGLIDSVCTLRMHKEKFASVCVCVCSRVFTALITNRPNIVILGAVTSVLMEIYVFGI